MHAIEDRGQRIPAALPRFLRRDIRRVEHDLCLAHRRWEEIKCGYAVRPDTVHERLHARSRSADALVREGPGNELSDDGSFLARVPVMPECREICIRLHQEMMETGHDIEHGAIQRLIADRFREHAGGIVHGTCHADDAGAVAVGEFPSCFWVRCGKNSLKRDPDPIRRRIVFETVESTSTDLVEAGHRAPDVVFDETW